MVVVLFYWCSWVVGVGGDEMWVNRGVCKLFAWWRTRPGTKLETVLICEGPRVRYYQHNRGALGRLEQLLTVALGTPSSTTLVVVPVYNNPCTGIISFALPSKHGVLLLYYPIPGVWGNYYREPTIKIYYTGIIIVSYKKTINNLI